MLTPDRTMQQLLARIPVSSTPLNFGPEGEPGVDVGLPATKYSRLIGSKSPARAIFISLPLWVYHHVADGEKIPGHSA